MTDHRAEALALLGHASKIVTETPPYAYETRALDLHCAAIASGAATTHAMVYLGDQMRELAAHQRAANLIAAFNGRAITDDAEYKAARAVVNGALFPEEKL